MVVTRRQARTEEFDVAAAIALSQKDVIVEQSTTSNASKRSKSEVTQSKVQKAELVSARRSEPRKSRQSTLSQETRFSRRLAKQKVVRTTSIEVQVLHNVVPSKSKLVIALKVPSRVSRDQPASDKEKQARVSNRVKKGGSADSAIEKRPRLRLRFPVHYDQLEYKILKGLDIRPRVRRNGYWPYEHHRGFKLGHNPWAHLNWPAPCPDDVRQVHKLLADYHKTFEFGSYVSMPAHGTQSSTNVDVVIQTIFAQSTGNENAIDTHSRLCNAFPFVVNGQKFVGKMPDWHSIRTFPREELEMALKQGGFQIMRAKFIMGVLDHVYQKNLERKEKGLQNYDHEGNPPDAKDFVPGMLSMDYLTDPREDNSDEAVLGRLIELSGIGIKSGMCVMAFSLKRPLFVVDTHVLRYCKWLGWIPKDAKENAAAMYLHNHIPDDIKYDLHNQIWTHCANENVRESKNRAVICPFCGSNPPAQDRDVSMHKCPVSDFLPPLEKRWRRIYRPKAVVEETTTLGGEEESVPQEPEVDVEMPDVDDSEGQDNVVPMSTPGPKQQTLDAFFLTGLLTPDSSPRSVSEELRDDERIGAEEGESPSKKLNLKKLKTVRFDDVPKEQVQEMYAAGFYLWEFRPMDNTFMEEWGTFDRKPRYKWERADIMDKDVAVTWEYANAVINGNAPHKWSKKSADEADEDQIFSALSR